MKSLKLLTKRTLAYTLAGAMLLSAPASAADLAEYDYELPTATEEIIDETTIDAEADALASLSDQDIILDSDDLSDGSLAADDDADEEIILDSFTEDMEEDISFTSLIPTPVSVNPSVSNYTPDADSIPDAEELIDGYITKQMYNYGIQLFSNESSGQNFGPTSYDLYKKLKKTIEDVAAGNISDTHFRFDISEYLDDADDTICYPWDFGLEEFPEELPDDICFPYYNAVYDLLGLDIDSIIYALNIDCAYESYWWDRYAGVNYYIEGIYSGHDSNGDEYIFMNKDDMYLCMDFAVSLEYCADPNERCYLDPKIPKSITSAINNAKAIAEKADNYEQDYEKMSLFKDEILTLTDYNFDALDDKYKYNSPWQIIWVFDGDPETKVVCEGYSKAFQYLCDLSGLNAITVNGQMYQPGEKPGQHAWNIVTLDDGLNYLVDITNCKTWDGYKADLFLQGGHGSVQDGYMIIPEKYDTVFYYIYDDRTLAINTEEQLTLPQYYFYWSDDPIPHTMIPVLPVKPTCTESGYTKGTYCSVCGEIGTPQKKVAALGHSFGDWKVTKAATVLASGSKERTCKTCKTVEKSSIKKLTPTIKLSATKKTIKKKKSYTLTISNLAKGDAVESVVSSKTSIATVKKLKTNQYKITAKSKKGSSVITVTLKSGKTATCKITVK